ncbi:hypothetical protein HUX88_27320 [Duganella sp. BJB1802]|uniref:hypothetical protein n=1 Tax=Duganella sp. BJB1802 TaxID=2744575 RepID=UPI001594CB90|nr:hypothetical protein [Duganella sp. BJB1802]NVD74211.1 hypothetical protein [Duganella sp. BJB1802]
MIQKIEQVYLQLLRIVLLLVATLAIVASVVLGVRYINTHDAQATPVKDEIKLNLSSYEPAKQAQAPAKGVDRTSDSSQQVTRKLDPLFEDYYKAVDSFIKAAGATVTLNKEQLHEGFESMAQDPSLGRDFLKLFIPVINDATKNPAILARAKLNMNEEYGRLLSHFGDQFKNDAQQIEAKKMEAQQAAETARASSTSSLYAAGAGFMIFAGLVLLIVLLKIERNLRTAVVKESGQAELAG